MRYKKKIKKKLLIEHREERYNSAIQKLIDGKVPPSYVAERYEKLKAVKD